MRLLRWEAIGLAALSATLITVPAFPQQADIPKTFSIPTGGHDYVQREVMIPMRDGVKLHTVITVPKGAKDAPILLRLHSIQRYESQFPKRESPDALQTAAGRRCVRGRRLQ